MLTTYVSANLGWFLIFRYKTQFKSKNHNRRGRHFIVTCKFLSLLQFSEGRWYAMEKFDTSSKCFTYDFGEDEDGFK